MQHPRSETRRVKPAPGRRAPKIFGIGLSRTGTASLNSALEILGFPSIHYPVRFNQIDTHAAATDIPVLMQFRELDRRYPGSRFIVTLRALEPWLQSCEQLWLKNGDIFRRQPLVMDIEKRIYGGAGFDRGQYTQAREHLHADIGNYFAARPGDVLYLDTFESKNPWQQLCPFLDVDVPDQPYPHQNRSDVVDHILLRLRTIEPDIEKLAEIVQINRGYLDTLFTREYPQAPMAVTKFSVGFEEVRIVTNACAVFGAPRIAKAMNVDVHQLRTMTRG